MGDGIIMSADSSVVSSRVVPSTRTPDDIAFELTTCRDNIRSSLQSHVDMAAGARARDEKHGFINPTVLRLMDSAQHYLQDFVRTKVTPSALIHFGARRPMAVGVMAGAAVGAVILLGPTRLLGWAAKAAAVWRIATAIRNR
jgi:hypothetical protein